MEKVYDCVKQRKAAYMYLWVCTYFFRRKLKKLMTLIVSEKNWVVGGRS